MKKFYKVNVFEKGHVDYNYNLISDSKCIGEIVVVKGKLKARELLTGLSIDVVKEGSEIVSNIYKQDLFGRDLYIKGSDLDDRNVVSQEELNVYIDNYDSETFCMKNELAICRKFNFIKGLIKKR